uniref:NADH-ubiquinone oxidoreductase chain 6 n=1 Tax=Coniophora olivacea TaxID=85977 RepID=A0A896Z8R3_9AGAM
MTKLLLNILAFSTLFSSVLVITSKNPVIAVTFLISVFVNAAGYLILSGIGFIGISYILLYVGAITVLFLFVIMMINVKLTDILETGSQYTKNYPLAFAMGLLFAYELFTIMPFTSNNVSALTSFINLLTNLNDILITTNVSSFVDVVTTISPNIADTSITNFLHIQAIGHNLYTNGAALLIVCSMILLLAMTAPIFISRKNKL